MNDMTNIDVTELATQVAEGTAVIKPTSNKGKFITGGIAVGLTAGAFIGGLKIGQKIEKNKFEDRIAALESAMYGDEYFEEDEEDEESEEEAPAKKSKKTSKPEKVEGEVED